jgi:putative hemolysin
MSVLVNVLILMLLIGANGVLSMAEFAIISARKARLEIRIREGDLGAESALRMTQDPNRFLSTIQIGITLIGILAGAFGGATLAAPLADLLRQLRGEIPYLDSIALLLVVASITYFTLLFGELVPKRVALFRPEATASLLSRPMNLFSRMVFPAVRLLSGSTEVVLRILGIEHGQRQPVTEEEIRHMMREGAKAGIFEPEEPDMVQNIFRLGDLRVGAVMTPRFEIVGLDVKEPPEFYWKKIQESGHTHYPVYDTTLDNVLGIVACRSILLQQVRGEPLDLRAVMMPHILVPEHLPAFRMLESFHSPGTHMVLVADEYGNVEGLVTLHNILETIVGPLPGDGKMVEERMIQRENGSWLADGMTPIDTILNQIPLGPIDRKEEGAHFYTLAGFVVFHLEHTPSEGDFFEWKGYRFEVVDMDGNRVDKVLILPIPQSKDSSPEERA